MAAVTDAQRSGALQTDSLGGITAQYDQVRTQTVSLCAPLTVEDHVVQSMPDASPARWHLAHTTWFFEQFLLSNDPEYRPIHPQYSFLFNSYYNAVGDRVPRHQRGILSRPTVEEIYQYRKAVDVALRRMISRGLSAQQHEILRLGLHHEQQHQELILTDIKHAFGSNPLRPAYRSQPARSSPPCRTQSWIDHPGGLHEIGYSGSAFCFDNETPRHRVYLRPFRLANRLVSCGEYLAFMEDASYRRPELWLSEGWHVCQSQRWSMPLYWERIDGEFYQLTLAGFHRVDNNDPICHLSYYEADAFARWSDARLPTEAEWEVVAGMFAINGSFLEADQLHPRMTDSTEVEPAYPLGMFGEVWQWTAGSYSPYPGYRPMEGALGEYNGKFMCNQYVLRGGSCATPRSHFRVSYRNFFPADARWQFTGLRLAQDA